MNVFNLLGNRTGSACDGSTRRDFLKIGALGTSAFMLPDLLRSRAAAAASGQSTRKKSVVWLWLSGGPTHIETFDPKRFVDALFGEGSVVNEPV